MVELDKLQKINQLASELKKHNFATTNDDAAKLAEEFYKEKTPSQEQLSVKERAEKLAEEFYNKRDGLMSKKYEEEAESTIEIKEKTEQRNPDISERETHEKKENGMDNMLLRKFELLIEMQDKKINQELDYLRSTINFMKARMENLNKEVETLRGKAISSPIQFERKEDQKEVQSNLKKENKEEPKDSPRSGKYSSKDVDIQKMFYFGKK